MRRINIIYDCNYSKLLFLIDSIGIAHVENDIRYMTKMTIFSWRQIEQNRDRWREQLSSPLSFLDNGATEEEEETKEEGKEK
jgi:hypothetical protein